MKKFVLGIAAGKGGVGKSTLTVNLAFSLQRMGYSVGIIDADIYGPSIRTMLPEEKPVSRSESDPEKIIPAQKRGIQFISTAFFVGSERALSVRAPIANAIIKQFFHSVEWGSLDFLLIDFPPGTGDIQLSIMQECVLSGGLAITTPQQVALQDVSKAIALFHQMHVPVLGVVENMSCLQDPLSDLRHYPFGKGGGKRLSQSEGIPFLGEIPLDAEISRSGDEGLCLWDIAKDAASVKAFDAIAKDVVDQLVGFEVLEKECLKKFQLIWKDLD